MHRRADRFSFADADRVRARAPLQVDHLRGERVRLDAFRRGLDRGVHLVGVAAGDGRGGRGAERSDDELSRREPSDLRALRRERARRDGERGRERFRQAVLSALRRSSERRGVLREVRRQALNI